MSRDYSLKQIDAYAQVVWFFRPRSDVARVPGSFSGYLLKAFGSADHSNFVNLLKAFPDYGFAMNMALNNVGGSLDDLEDIVRENI